MDEPIQYSLGQPPQRTGLGGFSLKATIVVAVGFFGFLLLQLLGLGKLGFTVVLPLTAVIAVLISVRWSSRTVAEMGQILRDDSRRRNRGRGHLHCWWTVQGAGWPLPTSRHVSADGIDDWCGF